MWITLAYDRTDGMMWLCTIAAERAKALREMKADKQILEHQVFDVMSSSFCNRLRLWALQLGIKEDEIPNMIETIGYNIATASDLVAKNAHKSN